MTTPKWLLNNLPSNLVLKGGYIDLVPGGYSPITDADESEVSIAHAIARSWATVTTTEPAAPVGLEPVEITIHKPYEGLTAEQLQAQQSGKEEVPAATGTPLGQAEDIVDAGANSSAIGQPATETVAETHHKTTKKAKA